MTRLWTLVSTPLGFLACMSVAAAVGSWMGGR